MILGVKIGTHIEISITVFSTWILSEPKKYLDGKKRSHWIPEFISKAILKINVMLEKKQYFASYKVLKDWKYETWMKNLKIVYIMKTSSYVQ